jgi:hypothetical protein
MSSWRNWWNATHDEVTDVIDRIPDQWLRPAIFFASALSLFAEMVLVRWHGTCFHAFAIFKNVSLLSCFLGLGIGFGIAKRRQMALAAVLPLLAVQVLLFGLLSITNLGGRRINPVAEQLVMGTLGDKWSVWSAIEGNAFLALVFVLNAVMFVPMGQLAGRLMSRVPSGSGYSLNLLGGLAGIAAFFGLSLLWTGPAVWLGMLALLLAPFLLGGRRTATVSTASVAIILIAVGLSERPVDRRYYSPYQVIALRLPNRNDRLPTPTIQVNHCFYQDVFDCSPSAVAASARNATAARYYNFPFELRPQPGEVCVVGAGTGNDVAAALRAGARTVTAVEIDPAILFLGRHIHPERPYADARVTPVVNDARSFFRQTDQRFDTIIYGLLDSHTNLGSMANVRIDSFVYTVEGFRDAARRLSSDGVLIVSYLLLDPLQGDRMYSMLAEAFPGVTPRAFANLHGGTTFVTGPGLDRLPARVATANEITADYSDAPSRVEVATDNWPFFYMKERTYPLTYLVMLAVLLALSAWLVRRYAGAPTLTTARGGTAFFLGAGFMLVETKVITELGLVFGNTWSVVAIAVGGILLMAYLANRWVMKRGPVGGRLAFGLLAASLMLGWGLTRLPDAAAVIPLPKLVFLFVLTLPLFCAGLIFSGELSRSGSIGETLSANLFGAMLGGFLEYNAMYFGYSSLYPLGLALYAMAFICAGDSKAGRLDGDPIVEATHIDVFDDVVPEGMADRFASRTNRMLPKK